MIIQFGAQTLKLPTLYNIFLRQFTFQNVFNRISALPMLSQTSPPNFSQIGALSQVTLAVGTIPILCRFHREFVAVDLFPMESA